MDCEMLNPYPESAAFRRSPDTVMRLARLGCAHPTRLSFLRVLLRRFHEENWQFDRPVFNLDARGVGEVVYRAIGPQRTYSLVCFSHDLPADQRSDRVIATAWDATFALFDGTPTKADLERLSRNVPFQEAGRITESELCLSRANRSVRLFDHVVERLSMGTQPDNSMLVETGYLMRTTAVYGSGKFGAADRETLHMRSEIACPFQAEMLSVWLIRAFTVDLVEHLARVKGGESATRLSNENRHALGVGNSTGLGMAPFLVRHPVLFNNWMMAREEALARVRSRPSLTRETLHGFLEALNAANENAAQWRSQHPIQIEKLADLRTGLGALCDHVENGWDTSAQHPWDQLWRWGEANLPLEAQEALLSLVLEPHGALIDGLAECMSADEKASAAIDGKMQVSQITALLERNYHWALTGEYETPDNSARFWYVSEDKLEPRLGERYDEPGSELELPLDIARQMKALHAALASTSNTMPIAAFLLQYPEHRNAVRRVQMTARRPFAEIRDNLICADLLPIDMLRCKLAFFGASRFDPRSDRWVRISLFQGMPYPNDFEAAHFSAAIAG